MFDYTIEHHPDGYYIVVVRGNTPMRQDWDIGVPGTRILTEARANEIGQMLSRTPELTLDKASIKADGIDQAILTIRADGTAAQIRLNDQTVGTVALTNGSGKIAITSEVAGMLRIAVDVDGYVQTATTELEAVK